LSAEALAKEEAAPFRYPRRCKTRAIIIYSPTMNTDEIRKSFLDFFREKAHTIVPSSSLLPDSPNLLFTNAGMNQFVPYFLGQEQMPYRPPRVADTQKCIRAGGKHNDLDDVGFDTYHHTFFEMLGNWSFGDYFKKEAITWAWELLVDRWKFPASRLYATVYRPGQNDPAEFDQEAYDHWVNLFASAGLDPKIHVISGDRKDNFWMMGETGPCGPCSEIHIDLTPEGNSAGRLVNQGNPLCIEVWNLVFIQLNANQDGTFSALPARHVDTGMGFERVAGIIECSKGFKDFSRTISNYDSGVFRPLFAELSALSSKSYRGTLPESRANLSEQEKIDVAFRVVSDHIRALCLAIADGIIPSNTDRNYVVRRILRRAVMFGRYLGFGSNGFLGRLVPAVVASLGNVFPELSNRAQEIREIIEGEEILFNRTLDRGLKIFEEQLADQKGNVFSPETAFMLYDTYGFPIDLTEVLVRERGLELDLAAIERLLEQQRERSRAAQEKEVIAAVTISGSAEGSPAATVTRPTEFVGFTVRETDATATDLIAEPNRVLVPVDRSPFYAEMGGQVSDTGELITDEGSRWPVQNVIQQGGIFYLSLPQEAKISVPSEVQLRVDLVRRRLIEANHTATHLLHWALHEVVSKGISQKGSFVGPNHLRFDFNSSALTSEHIQEVERLVNSRIIENEAVSWIEVPYEEVRGRADIMQFFGEKYGDKVRVVQIGGHAGELNGYSMELCGGTHVSSTGQIGLFAIDSEAAIAAGVRRIEALTGLSALDLLRRELRTRNEKLDSANQQLLELKKSIEKERAQTLQREADQYARNLDLRSGRLVQLIDNVTGEFLQALATALKSKQFEGVAVLFGKQPDQIHVLAYVSQTQTQKYSAGKLVQELTALLGGKGGGRPDLARGVGKDITKLGQAIERAKQLVAS
jgi:alanyl-tRNA synthetase